MLLQAIYWRLLGFENGIIKNWWEDSKSLFFLFSGSRHILKKCYVRDEVDTKLNLPIKLLLNSYANNLIGITIPA